jgi:cytochrome c biogenesis protein CcmG, thiol:disulfide interchange protein DsbE
MKYNNRKNVLDRNELAMRCLLLAFLTLFVAKVSVAQSAMSDLSVYNLNGKVVPFKSVLDTNGMTILCFWATWCVPCINELDALEESLEDFSSVPCKIVAVSTDEARTVQKVKPFVQSRGLSFDVYIDPANELMRFFQVSNIPFIIVFKQGKPVYFKQGYLTGDEAVLLAKIKQLLMDPVK